VDLDLWSAAAQSAALVIAPSRVIGTDMDLRSLSVKLLRYVEYFDFHEKNSKIDRNSKQ
jgi:hypothetical protein